MKDQHKQLNEDSTELKEFKSSDVHDIIAMFLQEHDLIKYCGTIAIDNFIDNHSLKYKKVKNTLSYYMKEESTRLFIARQASKILKKEFNLSSPHTCYTYWSFNYGKYKICIKYIAGNNRYLIKHYNADGKFKFETNSFKELFNKIKTLNK